jgi:hypothetical protein
MRNNRVKSTRPVLVALLAAAPLLGCGDGAAEERFTVVGEEQTVLGTVVDTKLTLCGAAPDKPGTCAGTMVVQPEGAGEAGRIALEVTRDISLKKGDQAVFLPQLNGSVVRATYRTAETGENVATSVVAEVTESE